MQQNTINCTHIEGDFRFLHICHTKKFEINPHGMNFRLLHICHVQEFEISPHDRFFLHGHRPWVRDKYEVWSGVPIHLIRRSTLPPQYIFSPPKSTQSESSQLDWEIFLRKRLRVVDQSKVTWQPNEQSDHSLTGSKLTAVRGSLIVLTQSPIISPPISHYFPSNLAPFCPIIPPSTSDLVLPLLHEYQDFCNIIYWKLFLLISRVLKKPHCFLGVLTILKSLMFMFSKKLRCSSTRNTSTISISTSTRSTSTSTRNIWSQITAVQVKARDPSVWLVLAVWENKPPSHIFENNCFFAIFYIASFMVQEEILNVRFYSQTLILNNCPNAVRQCGGVAKSMSLALLKFASLDSIFKHGKCNDKRPGDSSRRTSFVDKTGSSPSDTLVWETLLLFFLNLVHVWYNNWYISWCVI